MIVLVVVVVAVVCDRRRSDRLLRKEKDEASLPDCFWQDSLNAFILRFAGGEGFIILELHFPRWSL